MDPRTTVKQNYEFRRIYAKGISGVSPYLVVYCRKNSRGQSRVGFTVSAKIGHAVVRNRIRRRFRELYRLHLPQFKPGFDVIVVARGRAAQATYRELEQAYLRVCRKLPVWSETE